ncbi:MAG: PAS domain S-box protein [Deltaproteobacteria bacterium]|nr:PAS domain S-box protein [Deltaproteobacteria bacterium]
MGLDSILKILKQRGIFLKTFVMLMFLALIITTVFAVMIIPQERKALLKSMDDQARNIVASISEATASAFFNGDYGFVVEHNMQVISKSAGIQYIIVVRDNGYSLVHTPDGWEQKEKPDPGWKDREMTDGHGIISSLLVGKKVYHYHAPLQFTGIDCGSIYIGMSLDDFYEQLIRTYRVVLMVYILCLIIAAVISILFARQLATPIVALRNVTQRITNGDLSARASIASNDEVGHLAASFNDMTDKMVESRNNLVKALDELELHRQNLEGLVRKRTEQLTTTNRQLEQELRERVRAEHALLESEQRYRVIFDTVGNANMIIDKDDHISMINTAFEKLSGYTKDECEGVKVWLDFFPEEDRQKMLQYRALSMIESDSAPEDFEVSFTDKEGSSRWVFVTMTKIPGRENIIISLVDLTDIKRLEAQLLQSQKMEAVGKLAGGVAHDFNNILTAIIGYASLLKMTAEKDMELMSYVDPIISAAEKASHLTQGLLAFSRKQIIEPKHVDVNEVIKKVEHLLKRLMGEDIELKTQYQDKPVTVFADSGQLEQILINLATNARDAMPEGGYLSIKVETMTVSEAVKNEGQAYVKKPGKYALICVSDTGGGISKAMMDHVFEPFFTTKEVGKGTGLGLAIVYGVVKQHNGYINVYSEEGDGTTFKIYLPLIKSMAEEEQPTDQPKPRGGHETILVAEDDDVGRELTRIVLERFGYTVITAYDGDDALKKFAGNKDNIDMVLLDVIMPKQNGKAVHDAIKGINSDIKSLFVSGYTADIIHKKGIFESNINFVSKPIVPQELARKVREVLDA